MSLLAVMLATFCCPLLQTVGRSLRVKKEEVKMLINIEILWRHVNETTAGISMIS